MTPVESRSMCAVHSGTEAMVTCARCGRFACEPCIAEHEPPLCTTCAANAGDPYQLKSRPFSIATSLVEGIKLAMLEAGPIVLIALAFSIPSAALELLVPENSTSVSASMRLSNLYEALIGIIGTQAVLARLIARAEGRRLTIGAAFNVSLTTWGRCFGARFRAGLWILGFSLLLILPGVWKYVQLIFVSIAVLRTTTDPLEVSKSLVEGHWWEVFGLSWAGGLLVYVPAFVVVGGLGIATESVQFPAFITSVLSGWILTMAECALTSMMLVGFYGLHQTTGHELEPLPFKAPLS